MSSIQHTAPARSRHARPRRASDLRSRYLAGYQGVGDLTAGGVAPEPGGVRAARRGCTGWARGLGIKK